MSLGANNNQIIYNRTIYLEMVPPFSPNSFKFDYFTYFFKWGKYKLNILLYYEEQ